MEICEEQTLLNFGDELQRSPPEYPASQLPVPGSEEARAMTVGSGRQCSMLLELSNPIGAFSRILLGSSHWTNSEEYCYVWNRLDTRFALSAFQLMPLEPSIGDNESLLLATPRSEGFDAEGKTHGSLQAQVKLLPTPTVQDGANNAGPSQMKRNSLSLNATVGDSLNPRFVEELMGFPIDHTGLKPSETRLSRNRRTRSLPRSRKLKEDETPFSSMLSAAEL